MDWSSVIGWLIRTISGAQGSARSGSIRCWPQYRVRLMISLDRRAPLDPVEQRIKIIGARDIVLAESVGQVRAAADQGQDHFVGPG